jgi:type I restriction enzyme S subunit
MDYIDASLFDEELILLGEDGAPFFDRAKPVAFFSQGPVWPNNHVHVLRPLRTCIGRYLVHALNATNFGMFIDGSTRDKLTQGEMNRIPIALPTIDEQTAIATFLDHETAKIDALITEQEKLIALLAEKRQATISHAVTRGLNPDAPMKDSGVAWLGEVPGHWDVKRIKRIVSSIEQGWSPQCENFPTSAPDEWGVLKVGCVNGGIFRPDENKKLPVELDPIPNYSLKRGDLLISRANTRDLVGSAAVVDEDFANLMLCDKLYRLRLDESQCIPEFLAAYLGTPRSRSQIELNATGASSSMLNIGQSVILELVAPIPTVEEQQKIIQFLSVELQRLQSLITQADAAITLLKERRAALIAAAVTGQIDVRGAMAAATI